MADQTNGIGTQQAIDDLQTQNNQYLEQQQKLNDEIINKGIQKQENQVAFEKQQYEQQAQKQAQGLSGSMNKELNQYGTQNESLAAQGLQNSGYSESSRVNLYNQYQANVTAITTELNNEKAKLDLQLNQAYLDADIQKAQNAASIMQQKMQNAMNMYQLRYTLYRDQVSDEHWQKEFELSERQFAQNQLNADRDYQISMAQLQRS